jgi:hypothetical protein
VQVLSVRSCKESLIIKFPGFRAGLVLLAAVPKQVCGRSKLDEGTLGHAISVTWVTILQTGRSQVRFQIRLLDFINLPNPSSRTMALGFTEPLTQTSARKLSLEEGRGGRRGGCISLTTSTPSVENVGSSTFHNPIGFHFLLKGYLSFFTLSKTVLHLNRSDHGGIVWNCGSSKFWEQIFSYVR